MQKENQNHSYSLKSSASFNVIEFPYKNLPIEDIFNSTLVSDLFRDEIRPLSSNALDVFILFLKMAFVTALII
jgi:hypothetical protein